MAYLIAYDIALPKRLRKIAKLMERHAVRCQRSVFLFRGTESQLQAVLQSAERLIDAEADVVQAWQLASAESPVGNRLGAARLHFPQAVILQGDRMWQVEAAVSPGGTAPADDPPSDALPGDGSAADAVAGDASLRRAVSPAPARGTRRAGQIGEPFLPGGDEMGTDAPTNS